jgi:hypothetical protein
MHCGVRKCGHVLLWWKEWFTGKNVGREDGICYPTALLLLSLLKQQTI